MSKPISWYARRYVERFGFHLVPIEPGRKFPRSSDWGNHAISDPDKAEAFWTEKPDWNMGIALGPSRMCSLDIDCDASFAHICDEYGIPPEELDKYPTIQGRKKGRRIMFRVPEGVDLGYQKMNWPSRCDPTGDKHRAAMASAAAAKAAGDTQREERIRAVARRWARYTVFELRSSCDGKQRQDVAPPSVHPETGQPYVWLCQPKDEWPNPPAWLLAIWKDWERFKPQINAMCPWMPAEKSQERKLEKRPATTAIGGSVIDAFVQAHDLTTMLEQYGYTQKGRRRYLSPHSGTGLPGVIVFASGESCWIHHASDPLCSEDTGRPVSAFDLFCYYSHHGDIKAAVKDAAQMLGMDSPVRSAHTPPAASAPAAAPVATAPSRDHISPLPWTNGKDKPLNHIDNLREICRRMGVQVRYNVVKKTEELIIPGESYTMDNEANASLAWLASECSLFNFQTDKLGDFITYLADQNQYNPVATWIGSKPWDGKQRLCELFDTITAMGEPDARVRAMKETLIKRWMVAAVAAAYLPDGISAPGVLTLQGLQYLGKTKWFKTLVPAHLDLIQDGMILKPDDKDSVKQCTSYWLVELGELDSTFRKSDIAQLKAFITKQVDVLRLAYARRESRFPRRTLFFGSVNPRDFLHDPTGNRRFWTIECQAINHDHGLDMQQVWAEVYAMWKAGEPYYLSAEEMAGLNDHNADFMAADPIEERLLDRLSWGDPQSLWRWTQASTVLLECGIDRPTKIDSATAGSLIRARNGNQQRRSNGQKLLLCPPLRIR